MRVAWQTSTAHKASADPVEAEPRNYRQCNGLVEDHHDARSK